MALTTISGSIQSQPLNDNFSFLNSYVFKPDKLGFWADIGSGANISKHGDRILVGDAVDQDGNKFPTVKSWVGNSANGFMTYFDSRSEFEVASKIGGVGIAAASRSSDNVLTSEENTIGIASYVNNNNTVSTDKKSVWSYYGHADHSEDNNFTACIETDVCNTSGAAFVSVNPYSTGASGTTAGYWCGVGGETLQSGTPATAYVSVGIALVNTASSDSFSRFNKGFVFGANSIAGTDGFTGTGVAMEMAKGHELVWIYSSGTNANGGKIRSDCNSATQQSRVIFENGSLSVKGVRSADLTTEVNLFKVLTNTNAENYLIASTGTTGGAAGLLTDGSDTNIDIKIQPKGTGVIDYIKNATTAAATTSFSATHTLQIKANGTTYYIPMMSTTW